MRASSNVVGGPNSGQTATTRGRAPRTRDERPEQTQIVAMDESQRGVAAAQYRCATVIIANHNYAHFLPDAIDSALGQTHSRVQVIVVDDGSTDDSRRVIESYGDRI